MAVERKSKQPTDFILDSETKFCLVGSLEVEYVTAHLDNSWPVEVAEFAGKMSNGYGVRPRV